MSMGNMSSLCSSIPNRRALELFKPLSLLWFQGAKAITAASWGCEATTLRSEASHALLFHILCVI